MTALIELRRVTKSYRQRHRAVVAVDDVSLALMPGDILCVVGESGSGKSTIGRLVTGLTAPTHGDICHEGVPATQLGRRRLRAARLKVQMIQQDPYASLNPGLTVAAALAAPLRRHFDLGKRGVADRAAELLESVGLSPAGEFLEKYPHELSGGQRQRVAIARSLTVEPRVLVADEPVSMLDVSLRVSVLKQLRDLCEERELAVLFITHDLAVAKQFSSGHSIAVMQRGRIVEQRPTVELITDPQHPYTRALLTAARHEHLRSKQAPAVGGERHKQVVAHSQRLPR